MLGEYFRLRYVYWAGDKGTIPCPVYSESVVRIQYAEE